MLSVWCVLVKEEKDFSTLINFFEDWGSATRRHVVDSDAHLSLLNDDLVAIFTRQLGLLRDIKILINLNFAN